MKRRIAGAAWKAAFAAAGLLASAGILLSARLGSWALFYVLLVLQSCALIGVACLLLYQRDFLRARIGQLFSESAAAYSPRSAFLRRNLEPYETALTKAREYIGQAHSAQALKTAAELHALQNQINPHFLYNTLEVIRSKALMQGVTEIADMSESLATLFRYCINNPGELVTLEDEMENIRSYLLIQQYRFVDRFAFQEKIEDEDGSIMKHLMPVLTLQPIVENAIYHGLGKKLSGGLIVLHAYLTQANLVLEVIDNGSGISEPTLKEIRARLKSSGLEGGSAGKSAPNSMGIALNNVNQRIRFYFGDEYGLDVQSNLHLGTTVKILLPRATM